jgi:hypothetical protein
VVEVCTLALSCLCAASYAQGSKVAGFEAMRLGLAACYSGAAAGRPMAFAGGGRLFCSEGCPNSSPAGDCAFC